MKCCVLWQLAVLALGLDMTAAATSADGDWPQFRGPRGSGVSPARGLPTTWSDDENIIWKVELPGAGTSSPIVMGDRIFLTCYSGFGVPGVPAEEISRLRRQVVCLRRSDGERLWSREVPTRLPEQETIRESHGYASNTPVADERRVYASFGKSGVFAFTHDGQPLWQADIGEGLNGWGSAASLVLAGNHVIVNASVESEALLALDRLTGAEVWRADGIKESWNTPILVSNEKGTEELVVSYFGKVAAFEPARGERLWTCDTDIPWYMVPGMVAEGGIVYCIGGRSGGSLAIRAGGTGDVTRSHRVWTGRKGSNVSSLILHEGLLYWGNDHQEIVYCADARNGKLLYEERLPRAGELYASPVLADGKLYYVARTGRTFVLAAGPQFQLLATNDLGDRSTFNASPAVSGGSLFLRSDRHLYRIGQASGD